MNKITDNFCATYSSGVAPSVLPRLLAMTVRSALGLSIALSAGCAVVPLYQAPQAPKLERYVQPEKAGIESNTPQTISLGASLPTQWWTAFQLPQLNGLVRKGLLGNQSLASARDRLMAAHSRIAVAQAGLKPQVDFSAGAQRARLGATAFGPDAKDFPIFSAYSAGPSVSYDLDIFGGTRHRIDDAKAKAQYQAAETSAVSLTVSGNIVIQTITAASIKSQMDVVGKIISSDERNLDLVKAARQAGGVSDVDVLSAQSQLDHDRTLLPALHEQFDESRDEIAALVGESAGNWQPPDIKLEDFALPAALPIAVPSQLVHKRPDIVAAEANLHSASAAVGIATANLYPHVTLNAQLGEQGLLSHGPSELAWTLLGGISAPLFHGGALRAEQGATQHEYQASFADYQQTVIVAFRQVADAMHALSNDADALSTQKRALVSASSSLNLTLQGYRAGNAGYIQVLDAQRLEQQAELGVVQAQAQRLVDSAKLMLAAGGGFDEADLHVAARSSADRRS
ncbi:efflux transporter outer membrane subunit [Rhodanobacter sp. MP7CTX1]|uniref:efflux transporter outer membrane subunit n=1 Tax=Rhodanobacter sp. MP7CTX1 TaxID=2723084 RepID=UPI0016194D98|nr:efflux transporter outer membrane subunit [Rhodanobacter sp. MP7CTX1]MBB6187508.1 NodT family efflux transporter outer membrane factor (OMF) lipoprotein [Rhodanobacter sp. MP7CTX1]